MDFGGQAIDNGRTHHQQLLRPLRGKEYHMSVHLEKKDLINSQQMEIAVHGPDGATHLILCTGIAVIGTIEHDSYTFLVGPQLSRRQFVGAIASCALSTIRAENKNVTQHNPAMELEANLISIDTYYDDESKQVKVSAQVSASSTVTNLAISYNVNILAELPIL